MSERTPVTPRHPGPYFECRECGFDEFALRINLAGKLIAECCACGQNNVFDVEPTGDDLKRVEEETHEMFLHYDKWEKFRDNSGE